MKSAHVALQSDARIGDQGYARHAACVSLYGALCSAVAFATFVHLKC